MAEGLESWDWSMLRSRCRVEALRIVQRPHDAEEVVQEALVRAWRNRKSCRSPDAPLPWCLEITRNEARRLLGRRRPLGDAEPLESRTELLDARAHEAIERALERLDLERALKDLTTAERLLLTLRYEHDCSHPEIAAQLQISETAARIRLHRLHKRIEPLLKGTRHGGD